MRIGISTATLFRRFNTEDAIALFNDWKVGEAEVFLTSFCEYKEEFAKTLLANKGNVHINSVHALGTQFEPQLYSEQPRVKGDAYEILGNVMRTAQTIGAKFYTFHGPSRAKRTFNEDMKRFGAGTAEIYKFCEKFGVKLCYENVEWSLYNRPGLFGELERYCPRLGGVLDLKQARLSEYFYGEYLADMGEHITHVHVSDVDGNGKMCLPGKGIFNFDELFLRLAEIGFSGAVLIENYSGDFGELSELKNSYEYLAEKAEKYQK